MNYYLYCYSQKDLLNTECCSSCITDQDYGYPMEELEYIFEGHTYIMSTCCKHRDIILTWGTLEWETAIRSKYKIKKGHKGTYVEPIIDRCGNKI